ncbi:LuxR C-terminal-related transcriptional regulator [Puniceibacterium confluentis]|uniref:LuxR C-terminal-related transcriptional regulator n=1 Tax=Puniceibacterium confluentis TaxID=1958944 RepID=UPI0011B64EB2|nr:response regulator transcription factor [Puniceibacterium confluentis]
MKQPLFISVVDPNSLSCEGLKHVLPSRNFKIVNTWANIEDALQAVSCDVHLEAVLINLSKQALPSPQVMDQLRKAFPDARIVLIEEVFNPERIRDATQLKVDGLLLETINTVAFSKAVELIMLGERIFPVLPPEQKPDKVPVTTHGSAAEALKTLSPSELRVLALLAQALANKVIARDLGISESTVKVHVKSILRKTGSRNRTDAALLARDVEAMAVLEEVALKQPDDAPRRVGKSLNRSERAYGKAISQSLRLRGHFPVAH